MRKSAHWRPNIQHFVRSSDSQFGQACHLKGHADVIKIKRAYEPADRKDGYRILIDRLWPRGIRRVDLPLDEWAKGLAPSPELRKFFAHDPLRWREFRSRYRMELRKKSARERIVELVRLAEHLTITLVYGARDEEHNNAVVVREIVEREVEKSVEMRLSHKKAL